MNRWLRGTIVTLILNMVVVGYAAAQNPQNGSGLVDAVLDLNRSAVSNNQQLIRDQLFSGRIEATIIDADRDNTNFEDGDIIAFALGSVSRGGGSLVFSGNRPAFDAWVGRIAERVDLAGFLMTPESAFGYERRGTPETVAELGRTLGYEVVVVPQYTLDGAPIRSSDIRAAIAAGDLGRAEQLLGRRVSVVGTVARALREATELAFELPVALPPPGSYEAFVRTSGGGVRSRNLELDDRRVALSPALPVRTGARLGIELVRGVSATIRRS